MHSVCEKNPSKKKMKLSEDILDGPFVSQILKVTFFSCFYFIIDNNGDINEPVPGWRRTCRNDSRVFCGRTFFLQNLSFECEEIVKTFSWLLKAESSPCDLWFQQTFTSYGLCYSFNMMPMGDLLNGVE